MDTHTDSPSGSTRLLQTLSKKRQEAAEQRARYVDLLDRVRHEPDNAALLDDIVDTELAMARTTTAANALESAHAHALEVDRAEAEQRRKAAGVERLADLLKRVGARGADYKAMQKAADAFLGQLNAFMQSGRQLGVDARRIVMDVKASRAMEHVAIVGGAASGESDAVAHALAHLVREIVRAYGGGALNQLVAVNGYSDNPVTFEKAAAQDLKIIKGRLS